MSVGVAEEFAWPIRYIHFLITFHSQIGQAHEVAIWCVPMQQPPKTTNPQWAKPPIRETNAAVDKFLGQFGGQFPKKFDFKKGVGQQALEDFKELVKKANNGVCPVQNTNHCPVQRYFVSKVREKTGIRMPGGRPIAVGDAVHIFGKRNLCTECGTTQTELKNTMCRGCAVRTHRIEMSADKRLCTYTDPW